MKNKKLLSKVLGAVLLLVLLLATAAHVLAGNNYENDDCAVTNEYLARQERIQWEINNNAEGELTYYDIQPTAIYPISVDTDESLAALEERVQLEARINDIAEIEPYNALCLIAHSWGTGWSNWYRWGEVFHDSRCPRTGVLCVREESRHRVCQRCNVMQTEDRLAYFQCFVWY